MKKIKFTLLFLFYVLITTFTYSQGTSEKVCVGDLTLSSQAEVDAFDCTEVTGGLTISGSDITNLDGLSELKRLGSSSVPGLFFSLVIQNNPVLRNLDGFSSLTEANGLITINGNPSLEEIIGFSSLTQAGPLNISDNPALIAIKGFSKLESINESPYPATFASLIIHNNGSLSSIAGFSSLKVIQGRLAFLSITNNSSLANIDGLSSLELINGGGRGAGLAIENNSALRNVNGLSSLSSISGASPNLIIADNGALENLDGLFNLQAAPGFTLIRIRNNPSLTRCCGLFPLLKSLEDEIPQATIEIAENGAGCTVENIIAKGPCPQSISGFSLINERTGVVIKDFYDSITLDRADPDFFKWTIQANAFPDTVGSVVFRIDRKIKQTENSFPYALRKHFLFFLKPGLHTVTTRVYSKPHKRGEEGIGRTATINIINSSAILNFEVVDTSGKVLMKLNNGDEINIKDPAFNSFSIRANTTPDTVGSVKFFLNHRYYRTENIVPYALNGDTDRGYYPWAPRPGNHTLMATPYSKRNGWGYAGKSLKLHFKVIVVDTCVENKSVVYARSNSEQVMTQGNELSVSIYPVPTDGDLVVKVNYPVGSNVIVTIRNIHGQPVYTGAFKVQQSENYSIDTLGLQPGIYHLQILANNGIGTVVKFIKR